LPAGEDHDFGLAQRTQIEVAPERGARPLGEPMPLEDEMRIPRPHHPEVDPRNVDHEHAHRPDERADDALVRRAVEEERGEHRAEDEQACGGEIEVWTDLGAEDELGAGGRRSEG
jgi:hypothetical protein